MDNSCRRRNNVSIRRWWNGNDTKEEVGIKTTVQFKQTELWKYRLQYKEKNGSVVDRPRGKFYLKCNQEWGEADYLNENGDKKGRIWKCRMRVGAIPLQATLKSEHRSLIDTCYLGPHGTMGAIEDQQHMLTQCSAYEKERELLLRQLSQVVTEEEMARHWNDMESLTVFLLSDTRCNAAVRTFLHSAFAKHYQLLGQKCNLSLV